MNPFGFLDILEGRDATPTASGPPTGALEYDLEPAQLAASIAQVVARRGRLLAAYASDERNRPAAGLRVRYVFEVDDRAALLILRATPDAADPRLPSAALHCPAAAWPEREMEALTGIRFADHPDPRPMLLSSAPPGVWPLRHDFDPAELTGRSAPDRYEPVLVEGDEVRPIPLGPVLAFPEESVELRLASHAERLIHLEPRLYYKHRGVERLARGLDAPRAVALAERVCGRCAVSGAMALALALECASALELTPRGSWLRTAILELDRQHSHLLGMACLFETLGWEAGQGRAQRVREMLLGVAEEVFGSRTLLNLVCVGGLRRDVSAGDVRLLLRVLREAGLMARHLEELILEAPSVSERLEGVATLSFELLEGFAVTGPPARAAGWRRDARRDHPYLAYGDLEFWVPVYGAGDALARLRVWLDELRQSGSMVRDLLEGLPAGPVRRPVAALPAHRHGLALVESPRGALLTAVHTDARGHIERWHLHGASLSNWPAFAATQTGATLWEHPVAGRSFDLCVACVDR